MKKVEVLVAALAAFSSGNSTPTRISSNKGQRSDILAILPRAPTANATPEGANCTALKAVPSRGVQVFPPSRLTSEPFVPTAMAIVRSGSTLRRETPER